MTYTEFKALLKEEQPPANLSTHLLSLWYDGRGDWHKAHSLVDSLSGNEAARVHAYLHRKEGDISNADYWYRRANDKRPQIELDKEWEELVTKFLKT